MRSTNDNVLLEQFAQRLAELTNQLAEISRRLELVEDHQDETSPAQQTSLTIHSYDDDENSIQFLTENGFVILRPWEVSNAIAPAEGVFHFAAHDPDGLEREISVRVSPRLLEETALRTGGRIETSSQFWISCAERRLANYLMEHGEFPSGNEIMIESLEREDLLLTLRWGKSD